MNLQNHITPEILANEFCMDKIDEYSVFVEGEKDENLYSNFFKPEISIVNCHNKEKTISTIKIINERKTGLKYFGIVDKDYDEYFDINDYENLYKTDFHSIEIFSLMSSAFDVFKKEYFNIEKLKQNSLPYSTNDLRSLILKLSTPMGILRIINSENELNLRLKPRNLDDNDIKYEGFICKDKLTFLGNTLLVNTICRYYNQVKVKEKEKEILDLFEKSSLKDIDSEQIVHGHDVSNILKVVLRKYGRNNIIINSKEDIERALRLCYSFNHFEKSSLKKQLDLIDSNLFSSSN